MVVVITGASSGLGEYLAVELGRRGHTLGLIARREAELIAVAGKVEATGAKAVIAVADVTDRDAVHAAVRSIVDQVGPVEIMVANAGGGADTPAASIDGLRIARLMRLNFEGVVYAFEAVLPAMVARNSGHIVAVSSLAAWRGLPSGGVYSATKAAVSTMMEGMSSELRPLGIAVTTVHPGFVRTPMTAKAKHPLPFLVEPERAAQIMADGILARRREVNFPWPMALLMGLVHRLPPFVFEALIVRFAPKPRPPRERIA